MKFAVSAVLGLLLLDNASAFAPAKGLASRPASTRYMAMDMDMPPAQKQVDIPVIQKTGNGPADVRYSDFLKLVDADQVEKVTFSADGSQLLGVDVDGTRIKIEALPNDPTLLDQLTTHKVRQ